jgi:cobalt/nickel transport protein
MKRLWIFLAILAVISPVFGVWLAGVVGYHEPLDVAVEKINEATGRPVLNDTTDQLNWTPFLDYTIPGLPDWAGYIVSAFIGLAIYILLWLVVIRRRGAGRERRVERTG